MSGIFDIPEIPRIPGISKIPGIPKTSGIPGIPGIPRYHSIARSAYGMRILKNAHTHLYSIGRYQTAGSMVHTFLV